MKNIIILVLLVAAFSCNQKNKIANETSENIKESVTNEIEVIEKAPKLSAKKIASPLSWNELNSNFQLDFDSCNIPEPYNTAPNRALYSYTENSVVLAAFERNDEESIKLYDFIVSTCNKLDTLLESESMTDYYLVNNSPLTLRIYSRLPTPEGGTKNQPFIDQSFEEVSGEIMVKSKLLYSPQTLTKEQIQELTNNFFKQQPIVSDEDLKTAEFASEKYIKQLFYCALTGNEDCVDIFLNLEDRLKTDGAAGESYYTLKQHLVSLQ